MDDLSKFASELINSVWLVILAMWGGSVNYFTNLKQGKFNLVAYLLHLSTSAFAGLITAYTCAANDVSYSYTAALTGIAGHMGVSAIKHLQRRFFGDKHD